MMATLRETSESPGFVDVFHVTSSYDRTPRPRDPAYVFPKRIAETVASAAQQSLKNINSSSHFLLSEEDREIGRGRFLKREVILGDRLASGSFSDVYEVNSFRACMKHANILTDLQESARDSVVSNYSNDKSSEDANKEPGKSSDDEKKYVVKHLKQRLMDDVDQFKIGAIGLGYEAQILASISQPNIVKIWGWASQGTSGYTSGLHDAYFLILDRLYHTLHDRNQTWKKQLKRLSLMPVGASFQKRQFTAERLKVVSDIAGALAYLHKRNLIYRDLKPQNLAFDAKGNIQLFDFGLATEIPSECNKNETSSNSTSIVDETYCLTGCVGSMRYMAPEVGLYKPYNLKVDVYGFTVILYECMSLSRPFEGYAPDMMVERVFRKEMRPNLSCLNSILPSTSSIPTLITAGWADDFTNRPTMEEAHATLLQALETQHELLPRTSRLVFGRRASCPNVTGMTANTIGRRASCPNLTEMTANTIGGRSQQSSRQQLSCTKMENGIQNLRNRLCERFLRSNSMSDLSKKTCH